MFKFNLYNPLTNKTFNIVCLFWNSSQKLVFYPYSLIHRRNQSRKKMSACQSKVAKYWKDSFEPDAQRRRNKSASLVGHSKQRFVPSIGDIEKAMWVFNDQAVFGSTENFCTFTKLSYFWGQNKYKTRVPALSH